MQYLRDALASYSRTDCYPFHMPGHKRRWMDFADASAIDITEIDGFDNLHHAEGILKEAQERAAALYGSDRCFYLVNGSTCGLLAAICAAVKKRGRVLIARNCHKAVYHALFLRELQVEYIYPVITKNNLQGQVTPEQIHRAFEEKPDIAAIVVTSPTYEGILSDIRGISEEAHVHGVPLIVDEAHGAHLGFGGGFPENAVTQGADAVIMSLHKTLPSLTQTALLHLNTERIKEERIMQYLSVFETSSPSYLLMAGMDSCIRQLREQKTVLFDRYREMLDCFYRDVSGLKRLHVMTRGDLGKEDASGWDDSKLVIFTDRAGISGEELHQILRKRYHLQMEMASGSYVLGMTSILDEKDGFRRLSAALSEIEKESSVFRKETEGSRLFKERFTMQMYGKRERKMELYEAAEMPSGMVSFDEADGKISAGYILLYPPGIPLIVPGEIIRRAFVEDLKKCRQMGLCVEGSADFSTERIKIVYS